MMGVRAYAVTCVVAWQLFTPTAVVADGNTDGALYGFLTQMDSLQENVSYRVSVFSSNVDRQIAGAFEETNASVTESESERFFLTRWFDGYFIDDTHLDHTNRSYIRVRLGYTFDSKAENQIINDVKARIRLPLSQERFQLFIGDDTRAGSDLAMSGTEEESTGVGIRYVMDRYTPERMGSGTSVGISSWDDPFAKLYVDYTLLDGTWLIKPVQTFRYSKEMEFEEWTDLFIARRFPDDGILQLLLERSTRSHSDNMEYLAQLSYWNVNRHRVGFQPYMALYGRTKALLENYENGRRADSGVYNYAAGLIWRRNVLRDYFFYQIHPTVSFHERYGYRANYLLHLTFEIYFGRL